MLGSWRTVMVVLLIKIHFAENCKGDGLEILEPLRHLRYNDAFFEPYHFVEGFLPKSFDELFPFLFRISS